MEDAVFRIDRNDGKEWTPAKRWDFSEKKLMRGGEFLVSKKSDLVLGNPDYHSIPEKITKEEYDTFGVTWVFDSHSSDRIPVEPRG